MRRIFLSLAGCLLLVVAAKADVTGKWNGSADIETPDGKQSIPISAEFQQQDKAVKGTIGKQGEEQYPIEKGALEGGKLTFEFTAPEEDEASGKRLYTMRLNVAGESELQGEVEFAMNDEKVTAKVTLTRAK